MVRILLEFESIDIIQVPIFNDRGSFMRTGVPEVHLKDMCHIRASDGQLSRWDNKTSLGQISWLEKKLGR